MSGQTRLSLRDIEAYRGQGEGRRSGEHLRFYCPVHGSDNQRSLSLDPETGRFKCFACGAWGYLEEKRQEWIEERKKEARESNEKGFGSRRRFPDPTGSGTGRDTETAEADTEKAADRAEKLQRVLSRLQAKLPGSPGEEYMKKRGIPLELAQKYGVGYAPYGDWPHQNKKGKPVRQWKPGRVVFPHTDPEGRLVNLYGRAVGVEVPRDMKHDHLPGTKGIFNTRALRSETVFICEGTFDALSLIAAGYETSCAIFGVDGLRWDWVQARQIVFCMDPDEGGDRWRELAREGLLRGKEVYFLPEAIYDGHGDLNDLWAATGRLELGGWEKGKGNQGGEEKEGEESGGIVGIEESEENGDTDPAEISKPNPSSKDDIRTKLWVIESDVLDGEKFILVRNARVSVPKKYRQLPKYTFEEMHRLLQVSPDRDQLRKVHLTKKLFNGRILPGSEESGPA